MMAALSTYTDLITGQHVGKPNFLAVVGAALQPLVDIQNALLAMPTSDYDVDSAVGAQLDVIGAWVGAARRIVVPISGLYFSDDVVGVGLDEGVWFQNGDPTVAISELDDDMYRLYLKIKIAANAWDGTLAGAQVVFDSVAHVGVAVTVQDNFDMSITVRVSGSLPSALFMSVVQLATDWIRPAGVSVAQVIKI